MFVGHTWSVGISKLFADSSGISRTPRNVTDCSPLVVDTYFHSTLILVATINQTDITIGTSWPSGIHCERKGSITYPVFTFLECPAYLDTSLLHHHYGHLSSRYWKSCYKKWAWFHYRCMRRHPETENRSQDQNEHSKMPLHLWTKIWRWTHVILCVRFHVLHYFFQ